MCPLQKCVLCALILPFILVQLMASPTAGRMKLATHLGMEIPEPKQSTGDSQGGNKQMPHSPYHHSAPLSAQSPAGTPCRKYSVQLRSSSASASPSSSSTFVDPHHKRARTSPDAVVDPTSLDHTPSQNAIITLIRRNPTVGDKRNTPMHSQKTSILDNLNKLRGTMTRKISKWIEFYKTYRFQSELYENEDEKEKEQTVKVELQRGPFANGMQGQVYYGKFKRNHQKDEKMDRVAVKLIGPGTYKIPVEQLKLLTPEQIIEDPKKEIEILKKFNQDGERKHIIKLYDGGEIQFANDEAKAKSPFRYVVIQELGSQNLMDAFIEYRRQNPEINEEETTVLKEAAQVLVEIHEVAIHMDFKAENLLYVEEEVAANTLLGGTGKISSSSSSKNQSVGQHGELMKSPSQMEKGKSVIQQSSHLQHMKEIVPADEKKKLESPRQKKMEIIEENPLEDKATKHQNQKTRVLKAIDFGGSIPLDSSSESRAQLQKMTSTRCNVPPESDRHRLDKWHEIFCLQKKNEAAAGKSVEHAGEIIEEMNENANIGQDISKMAIHLSATTKSDSWQFGMMIYALALVRLPIPTRSKKLKLWKKKNIGKLSKINHLYKDLNDTKAGMSRQEWIKTQFNWPKYMDIFEEILQFRSENPRLFLLAHNLLQKDDHKRLSAQGILDYLNNECQLYADSIAQNLFIGPLTIEFVGILHGAKNSRLIDDGNVSLMEMHREGTQQECNRDFKPGEKAIISTYDTLKHVVLG